MSPPSDPSEPGDSIADFVVSKVPRIRQGETIAIVCLNGTFPLASAFARATRRAGARALILLQDGEARPEERPSVRPDRPGIGARPGFAAWPGLELTIGAGLTATTEERGRFFETLDALLDGHRITLTRPEAERVELAVGVEHHGGIDAFYFARSEGSPRSVPIPSHLSVPDPIAA